MSTDMGDGILTCTAVCLLRPEEWRFAYTALTRWPLLSLPPSGSCHQCPTRTTPYSRGIWTSFKWHGRWVLKSMLKISCVVFEARGVKYTALASVTLTSIRVTTAMSDSHSHQSQQDLNQHQPVWEAGVLKLTLTTATSNISLILSQKWLGSLFSFSDIHLSFLLLLLIESLWVLCSSKWMHVLQFIAGAWQMLKQLWVYFFMNCENNAESKRLKFTLTGCHLFWWLKTVI